MIQPNTTMKLEVKTKFSSVKNMQYNYGLCTYKLTTQNYRHIHTCTWNNYISYGLEQ